jgi:hypothetical protein
VEVRLTPATMQNDQHARAATLRRTDPLIESNKAV